MAKQPVKTPPRPRTDGTPHIHRAQGQRFIDRSLAEVSPNFQQFEPTDGAPINQHKRMAGVG